MQMRENQDKNDVAKIVFGSNEVKPFVRLLDGIAYGEVGDAKIAYDLFDVVFRTHLWVN